MIPNFQNHKPRPLQTEWSLYTTLSFKWLHIRTKDETSILHMQESLSDKYKVHYFSTTDKN